MKNADGGYFYRFDHVGFHFRLFQDVVDAHGLRGAEEGGEDLPDHRRRPWNPGLHNRLRLAAAVVGRLYFRHRLRDFLPGGAAAVALLPSRPPEMAKGRASGIVENGTR